MKNYTSKSVRETLNSLSHVLNSFISAAQCLKDDDTVSVGVVEEMQVALNEDWHRLKEGRVTCLEANHSKTRPKEGFKAPFCGDYKKCDSGEQCDECGEYELFSEKLKDNFRE